MKPKGTIIFDLDDTLIYTQKIKGEIRKLLKKEGLEPDLIEITWKEFMTRNQNHFDLKQYANFLKINNSIILSQDLINEFYSYSLEEFLKGNVVNTVKKLQKAGYRTLLLSKGEDEFQFLKIRNAGLYEIFNPNIFICTDKVNCLSGINIKKPVFFINDRLRETKLIRKAFPEFKYFHMNRDDDHQLYDEAEVDMDRIDTIEDLLKILK